MTGTLLWSSKNPFRKPTIGQEMFYGLSVDEKAEAHRSHLSAGLVVQAYTLSYPGRLKKEE